MPHPEHAVDPLLGSTDGALILGSLVDCRSIVGRGTRLGVTSEAEQRRASAGRRGDCGAQPLEVARPQRDRAAPRHAVGRVRDPDERLAAARLEQLDDDREALLGRAAATRHLLDDVACPQGVSRFGCRASFLMCFVVVI